MKHNARLSLALAFDTSIMPHMLKLANIILTNNNPCHFYRPISLLSTLPKIREKKLWNIKLFTNLYTTQLTECAGGRVVW